MKKLLLPLVLSFMALNSQAQSYHLDTNNDGSIELTDALIVINYILGKFNPEDAQQPQSYLACPDDHHPHLIDLGLPSGTKWACCNVGATTPEGYGGYYAWGETEEKEAYNEVTYLYCTGDDTNGDGWYDDWHEDSSTKGIWSDLGGFIARTQYDVAHVKWGGCWQMPSFDQINELLENCTFEWGTVNGINGGRFIGKNGASVFLPASGSRSLEEVFDIGNNCFYWASTLGTTGLPYADGMLFGSYGAASAYSFRGNGQSVRPVAGKAEARTYHLDVNNDSEIELTDALIIINYILGKFNPDGEWYMMARMSDGEKQMIPVKEVGSLIAVDDALDFTILGVNGEILLENVQRVDFKSEKEINSSEELSAIKSKGMPSKVKGITKTLQGQCTFVVADKKGNNNLVQELTFQHDSNGSSWNGDGLSGSIRDLQYIARTKTELATANSEDIIKTLEKLSGTDQADAEAVAATLNRNENVEEAYSADGENVVVKMKDDDSYAACPLYSLESVFADDGEKEILFDVANASKKLRSLKSYTGKEKVAIFNFFEGGFSTHGSPYETKHIFVQLLFEMFKMNLYNVELYGHGFDNGGTPTFTMSKLDEVISHSSEYSAIIIMSHGYTTSDGESYFATCEQYKKGISNPSNQTVIIDNNRFLAHPSKMNLASNCLLYLGPCYGISKNGYGNSNTSVIGWKGKNAISQIHAGVFFHKLLYSDGWVGVKEALESSFQKDPFNPSTWMYSSPSVKDWGFILNTDLQHEYAEGMVLSIGSGKDIFVKKTGGDCKFEISGYIKGNADDYSAYVKVKLEPIVRIQKPGEYSFKVPPSHNAMLSSLAGGNGNYFEDSYTIDDDFLEGVYRINVYVLTQMGWKLLIQPEPSYVIYSKKLEDNYALPKVSEEDVYAPTIIGSDGQPVEEITIPAGSSQTYQVDAYPGHTLETPCLDTDVATVSLSGNTLTVTGVSVDSTYFGVYDKQNHQLDVVKVTVTKGGNMPSYLTCPDDHHPHLIDLGLPSGTKWACCNVGATTPEGYGGYYAWGETEEKDYYDWSTYIHYDVDNDTCHDLGIDIAGTQYDVAHVKWGGSWVMPSKDQIAELKDNCSSEWTTVNGINGRMFTGSNGGSVFLPAAGYRWGVDLRSAGSSGGYWSSAQRLSDAYYAYDLYFYSDYVYWGNDGRNFGQSVRPVSR